MNNDQNIKALITAINSTDDSMRLQIITCGNACSITLRPNYHLDDDELSDINIQDNLPIKEATKCN